MAVVRDGIYLEDNPPARSQFRKGRRDPVKAVIVIHTAESGTDRSGPDGKAEAVAGFIQRRSDPGSYHLLGDSDSIVQMIRFSNEAFHDRTGSNRWAIGISLAMNAGDWPGLTEARRLQLVDTAAQMSVMAGKWLQLQGLGFPYARLLTQAESDDPGVSGFISHARRDPGRRTDPGDGFPWDEFFQRYSRQVVQDRADGGGLVSELEEAARDLQRLLISWGADLGTTGPSLDGVDGDPGLKTVRSATLLIRDVINRFQVAEVQVQQLGEAVADSEQRAASLQAANAGQAALIDQLRQTNVDAATLARLRFGAERYDELLAKLRELRELVES